MCALTGIAWGSAPDPGIYRIDADPEDKGRRAASIVARSSVSAPESALGSRPRVSLSSAQVRYDHRGVVARPQSETFPYSFRVVSNYDRRHPLR